MSADESAATAGQGGQARLERSRVARLREPGLLAVVLASLLVVCVGGLVQITYGAYTMSLSQVWAALVDPQVLRNPQAWRAFLLGADVPDLGPESMIVWNGRLPRVIVAIAVGANLSISGAIFQAITRNELASPFVLGVSSGAGVAIVLTLVVFGGLVAALPLIAALGGAAAFLLVYAIAWKNGTSPVRLVLAGIVVTTTFGSLETALFFFAQNVGVVQSAIAWTTGSLTGADWEQVRMVVPWSVLVILLALAASRQLNVLLLGERTARSLGMSVERVRFGLAGVAILAAASSIAVAGIVSFAGLVVPHVVRTVVGSDQRRLLVGCLFAGPALLVAADVGARLGFAALVGAEVQLPVGIVTGLVGGPYFLYLLWRREAGVL